MTTDEFIRELEKLSDTDWQQLADGKQLQLLDDQTLVITENADANVIVLPRNEVAQWPSVVLKQAEVIVTDYYRRNPLSLSGFNQQFYQLAEVYGLDSFAAADGVLPEKTLFVEGGELLAEVNDSPRFQYGVYCELETSFEAANAEKKAIEKTVKDWVDSGAAYERYIEMNVCRYSC